MNVALGFVIEPHIYPVSIHVIMRRGFLLSPPDKSKASAKSKLSATNKSKKCPALLPELMIRITKLMIDDKRSLARLSQTSRDWYMAAVPSLYSEIGPEFHQIARMFSRCDAVAEDERHMMVKKLDKDRFEGHPMDWHHAVRLTWTLSHVKKIVYRPINNDIEACQRHSLYGLEGINAAMVSLHGDSLLPMLDFLVIDLRDFNTNYGGEEYTNEAFDEAFGEALALWGERYGIPPMPDGCLLNSFVDYISGGEFEPQTTCLSPGSTSVEDTMPLIGHLFSSTVILHDFGAHRYDNGLPYCHILIIDFHMMLYVVTPDYRLSALRRAFHDEGDRPRARLMSRVLFTRSPWPKPPNAGVVNSKGAGDKETPNEVQVDGRLYAEERDEAFENGVNELFKARVDSEGNEMKKLEWGYLTGDNGKTRCRGCDRESRNSLPCSQRHLEQSSLKIQADSFRCHVLNRVISVSIRFRNVCRNVMRMIMTMNTVSSYIVH